MMDEFVVPAASTIETLEASDNEDEYGTGIGTGTAHVFRHHHHHDDDDGERGDVNGVRNDADEPDACVAIGVDDQPSRNDNNNNNDDDDDNNRNNRKKKKNRKERSAVMVPSRGKNRVATRNLFLVVILVILLTTTLFAVVYYGRRRDSTKPAVGGKDHDDPDDNDDDHDHDHDHGDDEYHGATSRSPTPVPRPPPTTPTTKTARPTQEDEASTSPTGGGDDVTAAPTASSTGSTGSTTGKPTTTAPTHAPTSDPFFDLFRQISGEEAMSDRASPQYRAYRWILDDDRLDLEDDDENALLQRYLVSTLHFAMAPSAASSLTAPAVTTRAATSTTTTTTNHPDVIPALWSYLDVCEWPTVVCSEGSTGFVTELLMARGGRRGETGVEGDVGMDADSSSSSSSLFSVFEGTIPSEIGWLPGLESIDLAENRIRGRIPNELYDLSNLKYLYLHNNDLTGPALTEEVVNLQNLTAIYLGNNRFTGSIPQGLESGGIIRPLRYLSLHNNRMNGTIPHDLRLRHLFYLDLSNNDFTGTLPVDVGEKFVKLRHLYLQHNRFTGTIPESFATIGNGRLIDFVVNDNQLTGKLPGSWTKGNIALTTVRAQRNRFTEEINKTLCKLSVFEGGEVVELGADCDICICKTLCDNCY